MSLVVFFSVILAAVPNGNARQNGDTGNRYSKLLFIGLYMFIRQKHISY